MNISQMREKLADMEVREGFAYSSLEVQAMRDRIAAASEKLDAETFFQVARERLEADYGQYEPEVIEKAAKAVSAQWQAEGRELDRTLDGAGSLAAAVGNALYNSGSSFNPHAAVKREPATLFGQQLAEAQDKATS